jgi:2-alkenal reductase
MKKRLWVWLVIVLLFVSACATLRQQAAAPNQDTALSETTPTIAVVSESTLPSIAQTTTDATATMPVQAATPTAVALEVLASNPSANRALLDAEATLVDVYRRVSPAVVYIETEDGSGSGFVYDRDGHIITNNHVVEGARRVEVVFSDGRRAEAEVVGRDVDADVAVLRVDVPADKLVVAELGDSSAVEVGQYAIAIGNPYGLQNTMTIGVVSGVGRTIQSDRAVQGSGRYSNPNVIQTDAAINPGNSGGPLLDSSGRVIGINTAIRSATQGVNGQLVNSGVGFAVPINTVKRIVPALIADGRYSYPWLGISSGSELDLQAQAALGLPQGTGVYVTEVTPGGPADDAGIRAGTRNVGLATLRAGGDLIIAVDGQPLRDFADLIGYLVSETEVGQTITFTIIRDGAQMDVQVTLGARP